MARATTRVAPTGVVTARLDSRESGNGEGAQHVVALSAVECGWRRNDRGGVLSTRLAVRAGYRVQWEVTLRRRRA